jgi:aspartyl-tRNA(Asn)/glutamyl-tRNA(Gln) amidotransferase subunit A
MAALAGFDPLDPVSIQADLGDPTQALNDQVSALRIGLPRGFYFERLDPDIERNTRAAVDVIRRLSAGTRNIDLPAAPDFSVLLAEAYEYHQDYLADPANHSLYDPVTLERITAAGSFSAADYIDSRRQLELARRAIPATFEEVDLIVTPTVPVMPTRIENAEIPETATGAESTVRNTAPFNVFGIPTISVPCGLSRDGLPIGIQISGPKLGELPMFALAHAFEQATNWHRMRPPTGAL